MSTIFRWSKLASWDGGGRTIAVTTRHSYMNIQPRVLVIALLSPTRIGSCSCIIWIDSSWSKFKSRKLWIIRLLSNGERPLLLCSPRQMLSVAMNRTTELAMKFTPTIYIHTKETKDNRSAFDSSISPSKQSVDLETTCFWNNIFKYKHFSSCWKGLEKDISIGNCLQHGLFYLEHFRRQSRRKNSLLREYEMRKN